MTDRINRNILEPSSVPISGVDHRVSCNNCTSACCHAGTVMPLTKSEVTRLVDAGTEIHISPKSANGGNHPGIGRLFYRLATDCGNLKEDPETGKTYCAVWGTGDQPNICRRFQPGSLQCVLLQLGSIRRGEAVHEP